MRLSFSNEDGGSRARKMQRTATIRRLYRKLGGTGDVRCSAGGPAVDGEAVIVAHGAFASVALGAGFSYFRRNCPADPYGGGMRFQNQPRGEREELTAFLRRFIVATVAGWRAEWATAGERVGEYVARPLCSTCYGKGKLPTNCRACHGTGLAS